MLLLDPGLSNLNGGFYLSSLAIITSELGITILLHS